MHCLIDVFGLKLLTAKAERPVKRLNRSVILYFSCLLRHVARPNSQVIIGTIHKKEKLERLKLRLFYSTEAARTQI